MKPDSIFNQPMWWYWRSVLQEVLHKHDLSYACRFTSIRGQLDGGWSAGEGESVAYQAQGFQRFYLNIEKKGVYLTAQEACCMYAVLRGKNLREVAVEMGLSIRTIEYYIKNLKKKTGSHKRSDLFGLVLGSNFMIDYEAYLARPPVLQEPEPKQITKSVVATRLIVSRKSG